MLRRMPQLLTSDLPGTGGLVKAVPEDFVVDELPAYSPSGEGPHTFLHVQKRALTTEQAVLKIAAALGVRRPEVGIAGQKDRQAITRQWISVPAVDPERALALRLDGISILSAARHGNKLRTGHLHGNRFTLTVRGTNDGVARARAILERLGISGLPNFFGAQRFGARGDNAVRGRALLAPPGATHKTRIAGAERRLLVSAYQSELFNRYLERRMRDQLLFGVVDGDILKKSDTGGLFTASGDALAEAQARLSAGAVALTGPMFGHKMMAPPPGSAAAAREAELLAEEGLDATGFAALGKLAEGTRRPLTVPLAGAEVAAGDEPDAIVLRFALPPGAYATILLAEVTKQP
jgi:tRNA pseudouridine13 synthase